MRKKGKQKLSVKPESKHTDFQIFINCVDCQKTPSIFIVVNGEQVGVCAFHWEKLGSSDTEWGELPKKEMVAIKSPLGTLLEPEVLYLVL